VVQNAVVKIRNLATGLEQTSSTNADGSFNIADLPIGTYSVTFSRDGFKTEVHSQILVQGNRTTTLNAALQPGAVSATVTVEGTPLLNQTDTTNLMATLSEANSSRIFLSEPAASPNLQFWRPASMRTF
jgi:hypothetical protein